MVIIWKVLCNETINESNNNNNEIMNNENNNIWNI